MADEIGRMDALVQEVQKLRADFASCKEKLASKDSQKTALESDRNIESQLRLEQEKNEQLSRQLQKYAQQLQKAQKELKELQKKNAVLQTRLEAKNEEIFAKEMQLQRVQYKLKKRAQKKKTKPKRLPKNSKLACDTQKIIIEKKEKQVTLALDKQKHVVLKERIKTTITKPKTYRTNKEAAIYDGKNGNKIANWEKGRSFTSYIESGEWIKITGYFVNRKWRKAKKELWIKKEDAMPR